MAKSKNMTTLVLHGLQCKSVTSVVCVSALATSPVPEVNGRVSLLVSFYCFLLSCKSNTL